MLPLFLNNNKPNLKNYKRTNCDVIQYLSFTFLINYFIKNHNDFNKQNWSKNGRKKEGSKQA